MTSVNRTPDTDVPEVLDVPQVLDGTALGDYVRWLAARGHAFTSYEELWRWSIEDLEAFWTSIWEYFGVHGSYERALGSREMPGAQWFPGAQLNYAEHMLGRPEDRDTPAVIAYSQTREQSELTFGELADQVGRARAGLRRLGVGRGDRVVGFVPNIPEALVAFLACASLGAIWASCAPEFGARSVVDRVAQIEPTVLIAIAGYTYGAKEIDKTAELAAIRAGLPTLRHVVGIDYGRHQVTEALPWSELLAQPGPVEFDRVPFDHPLYVLFSSGTTGLPKAIVHGHGGILLEHLKTQAFHLDTRPGDRVLWFTTTGWAMWNIVISGLLRRAALVVVDGNPLHPDLGEQWRIAAETGVSLLGTSPAYLMACRAAGIEPARVGDLRSLRTLGITGSPLPGEGFDWAMAQLGDERAGQLDQRRHRHLLRVRRGQPVASGVPRRALRSVPRRRRHRLRPGRQRGRRRGRGAGDPPSHAVDARQLLERPRWRALPQFLLRRLPRGLAARGLGHDVAAPQLRDLRPLGRDAQPRRGPTRHRRVLRRGRGAARASPTRWWSTWRTGRAGPARCCCSSRRLPGPRSTTGCATGSAPRCAASCPPGTCPTRSSRSRRYRAR